MSAKNQSAYLNLTAEINSLELQRDQLIAEHGKIQAQITTLETVTIPGYQKAVIDWEAAGNSDIANKNAKIAQYSNGVATSKAARDALLPQLQALDFQLRAIKNELENKIAQRTAFVSKYDETIVNGGSTHEAEAAANGAADQEAADQKKGLFEKPLTWVIIGVVVIGIIAAAYFIKRKK